MGTETGIDLRAMVREVLREAIATHGQQDGRHSVAIRTDADLQAFVEKLAALGVIEAVRAGTLRFTLAAGAVAAATVATPATVTLEGVVSERRLQGIDPGTTVRLVPTAVLTPMAKDAGRRLGLKFERIKQ